MLKKNQWAKYWKKLGIITDNEINKLGINLVKQQLEKPLSFHLDNLRKNNISFSRNKIKYHNWFSLSPLYRDHQKFVRGG